MEPDKEWATWNAIIFMIKMLTLYDFKAHALDEV